MGFFESLALAPRTLIVAGASALLAGLAGAGCSATTTLDVDDTSTSSGAAAGGAGGEGGAGTTSSGMTTSSAGGAGPGGAGGAGTGGSPGTGGAGTGGTPGTGGGGTGGAPPPPPPPPTAEVYAHSASTLYKLDPITNAVTTVGNFSSCNGSVIDIALDKNGVMYGTMFSGLVLIDKLSAVCTVIALGGYPNSLSFVPEGTVDPLEEALVGYNGATYVRIDKVTGAQTNIGNLGGGYSSSGDMVSLIGGGSYLTVNGNGCGDCIVEVDPATGALVSMIGPLGHSSVFGLAYWGGVAYGFNDFGELFQIDVTTAATMVIPIPMAPPGLSFYGAGSTTAAPHM